MSKTQYLYPVSRIETDLDFALLSRFEERNLVHLQKDYLHLPNNKIIPPLMRMEARYDAMGDPMRRRPYRAGVIAGSIILRARLHELDVAPGLVFSQDVIGLVDWRHMRASRFALRQYFAEGVDVQRHLHEVVEQPWARQNNKFAHPDARSHILTEDWMAVGLGDVLRLGELAYAQHFDISARGPLILRIRDSAPA